MEKPPRLRLKKELSDRIRAGHPWIYADALAAPRGLETGAVVDVVGRGGFLARGLYDARSPIAVRIYTLDPEEALDARWVRARVAAALKARRGAFSTTGPERTDAFRWLNGEGDLLPGVVADVYGPVVVVRFDGEAVRALAADVAGALAEEGRALGVEHIYERSRAGQGEPLRGGPPPSPVEIHERGVRFAVDVVHGQKTGFFLDQRENRAAIRPYAAGHAVANLFGYTGGFSVQAALGGARTVATVDSAAPALEAARANFRLNGLDPDRHEWAAEDAFAWLERARASGRRFGLVVVDPPSFAPREKSRAAALKAYRNLNALALSIVEPDGVLAAASCSSHVDERAFLDVLGEAGAKAKRALRVLEVRGQPADHPSLPAFPEGRYLKFVLLRAAP